MLNRDLVITKLDSLKQYLSELENFENLSFEEYQSKIHNRRSVERLIQLLVECASDINAHILAKKEKLPVEDYRSSFRVMGEKNYLSKKLAQGLSKAVGMRNILVHDYETIDDRIVFDAIPLSLDSFKKYMNEILAILQ
jgi:uncharacterized protein YutE (UPF0331/DUF86 family)